jgi:IS30 family transposase
MNENTNGIIREYFPKGDRDPFRPGIPVGRRRFANDRPRAMLAFRTLGEVFAELMLQKAEIPPA